MQARQLQLGVWNGWVRIRARPRHGVFRPGMMFPVDGRHGKNFLRTSHGIIHEKFLEAVKDPPVMAQCPDCGYWNEDNGHGLARCQWCENRWEIERGM